MGWARPSAALAVPENGGDKSRRRYGEVAVQGCETPAESASRVPSAQPPGPPQLAPLPFCTLPGGSVLGLPSACRVFFCTWALGWPRGVPARGSLGAGSVWPCPSGGGGGASWGQLGRAGWRTEPGCGQWGQGGILGGVLAEWRGCQGCPAPSRPGFLAPR